MAISIYQITVPVFIHLLNNLTGILKKGEKFAKEKDIEQEAMLEGRLAPDMFPLSKQIQLVCDLSRRCVERLAGMDVCSTEDNEKTFAEFYDRISNTVAFLESVKPEQLDGAEEKIVTIKMRDGEHKCRGLDMALYFSIPNVYFHVTTAYDILRHNYVDLGKKDFIGEIPHVDS